MKSSHSQIKRVFAMVIAVALVIAAGANVVFAAEGAANNKYYNDYNTMDEALAAAAELNVELSGEGNVLLKNDGTLPMRGTERISVFGVRQDNLLGAATGGAFVSSDTVSDGSVTVAKSLEAVGFKVNPTLVNFYANDNSSIGKEILDFTGEAAESMEMYDDAAVIVFTREGGEGTDASTKTSEKVGEDDDHKALYTDETGSYKHALMLTDSEEALVEYVTARLDGPSRQDRYRRHGADPGRPDQPLRPSGRCLAR